MYGQDGSPFEKRACRAKLAQQRPKNNTNLCVSAGSYLTAGLDSCYGMGPSCSGTEIFISATHRFIFFLPHGVVLLFTVSHGKADGVRFFFGGGRFPFHPLVSCRPWALVCGAVDRLFGVWEGKFRIYGNNATYDVSRSQPTTNKPLCPDGQLGFGCGSYVTNACACIIGRARSYCCDGL